MAMAMDPKRGLRTWSTNSRTSLAHAEVVSQYIKSQTWIKFGLYGLAAFFVCIASLLVVFAPEGRETAAGIVACALFVLAVGAAGFSSFAFKTPFMSAQAGSPEPQSGDTDLSEGPPWHDDGRPPPKKAA
jgi:hypothetical protein